MALLRLLAARTPPKAHSAPYQVRAEKSCDATKNGNCTNRNRCCRAGGAPCDSDGATNNPPSPESGSSERDFGLRTCHDVLGDYPPRDLYDAVLDETARKPVVPWPQCTEPARSVVRTNRVARQCASLPVHVSLASLKRCPGPFLAHYEGLTPAIEPHRRSARLFIKKSTQGRLRASGAPGRSSRSSRSSKRRV